jgi:hypothetical protein
MVSPRQMYTWLTFINAAAGLVATSPYFNGLVTGMSISLSLSRTGLMEALHSRGTILEGTVLCPTSVPLRRWYCPHLIQTSGQGGPRGDVRATQLPMATLYNAITRVW